MVPPKDGDAPGNKPFVHRRGEHAFYIESRDGTEVAPLRASGTIVSIFGVAFSVIPKKSSFASHGRGVLVSDVDSDVVDKLVRDYPE